MNGLGAKILFVSCVFARVKYCYDCVECALGLNKNLIIIIIAYQQLLCITGLIMPCLPAFEIVILSRT